jgi:hypothetical protein
MNWLKKHFLCTNGTVIPLYLGHESLVCRHGIPHEGSDDIWVGEAIRDSFTYSLLKSRGVKL